MEPDNYKRHTPEEWQRILQNVLAIFHKNPHDGEALDAIKESVDALNAYEQPAIEAGQHLAPNLGHPGAPSTGWGDPAEAVKGVVEGGIDAMLFPFHAVNSIYRHGGSANALIDEIGEGLTSIPGTIKGGDARRIGQLTGNVAGSIGTGKFLGKVGKGAYHTVKALAERPGLKNTLLHEQIARTRELGNQRYDQTPLNTALLEARKTMAENKVDQMPVENEMRGNRNSILENQVEQIPKKNMRDALNDLVQNTLNKNKLKVDENKLGNIPKQNTLLDQTIERGDPTLENINLRNELLRRKLEGDETPPDPMDILNPKEPNAGPSILDYNKKPTGAPIPDYDPNSPEATDPYGLDRLNNSWRPTPNPDNPPDLKLVKDPVDILADELNKPKPKPPKK